MAKRRKPAEPAEVESHFSLTLNEHTLTGQRRGGVWSFHCESWPDLARKHKNAKTSGECTSQFLARALAGCIVFKALTAHANGG